MTGPNWQADMMNRLDDAAAAEAARTAAAPVPPHAAPVTPPPAPTMPPPPPATGEGWQQHPGQQQYPAQPYPPQQQQYEQQVPQYDQQPYQQQAPQYPPQQYPPQQYPAEQPPQQYPPQQPQYQQQYPPQPPYEQPPYGPPPQVPPAPYQQPYAPYQGQQQYPPQQEQQYQGPAPQYYEPPPQQQYPQQPQYQATPQQPQYQATQEQQYQATQEQQFPQQQAWQQPPPQQQQWEQPAAGDGSWNEPSEPETGGWNEPAPDGGPGSHAYAPAYQDPLAAPLPAASGPVGLQHEDPSGGFFRKIGRFAAEAAYIAGASGRMQRDVENIAIIRRPIGIGRMIGVIGPVAQSGTSIVTALLADVISSQRGDIVLAIDAFPLEGKLTHRLDQGIANTPGSRVQLARSEPTADAISDVLAARNVGGANQIPLSLVDCPSGLFEEATGYVAGAAHAVALVIPSSRNSALASIDQLDQLSTDGQQMLVDRGLVIIAENVADDPEPVRWLQSAVTDRGLGYVVLPFDAHLTRAWPLQPERLDPATRRAVLEFAARLVQRATR